MLCVDFPLKSGIWCEDNWMKSWILIASIWRGSGAIKRANSVSTTALPVLLSCTDLLESPSEENRLKKCLDHQTLACDCSEFEPAVLKEICQTRRSESFYGTQKDPFIMSGFPVIRDWLACDCVFWLCGHLKFVLADKRYKCVFSLIESWALDEDWEVLSPAEH